jgi:hypothetical protein
MADNNAQNAANLAKKEEKIIPINKYSIHELKGGIDSKITEVRFKFILKVS